MKRDFEKMGKQHLGKILCLFVVGLTIIGWLAFHNLVQFKKYFSGVAAVVTNPISPLVTQFPILQFGTLTQPTTVLFMGTDVVYTDATRRHADPKSCQGNSDTMMLVFLNPAHSSVSVLNIPRDTEAYVGRYGVQKINSANVLGGPELAVQTVSTLLDVHIDHYLVMNIQGLVELVNELHGVTIEVPKKMSYMDWTGKLKIDLQPGIHTLTGNQAMGFVRFRHDALGDIGRIQRQQIFLQAVTRKMLDPTSWFHLKALMDIAQNNIRTDMSNIDIFQALNFVHSVPRDDFKFVMLPGDFAANGDWLASTRGKDIAQRLANPDQENIDSRRNITVCVVNASSDRLLGGKLATALHKIGYVTCVGQDENEPSNNKTRIVAQNGNITDAKMMQQDLGNVGEVVRASVGNLTTAITIVVHDDIKLDQVKMSSIDAPYVPFVHSQPLVSKPLVQSVLGTQPNKQTDAPAAENNTETQTDEIQQDPHSVIDKPNDKTTGNTDNTQSENPTINSTGNSDNSKDKLNQSGVPTNKTDM